MSLKMSFCVMGMVVFNNRKFFSLPMHLSTCILAFAICEVSFALHFVNLFSDFLLNGGMINLLFVLQAASLGYQTLCQP